LPVSLKVLIIKGCIRPIKYGAAYLLLATHYFSYFNKNLSKFERTTDNEQKIVHTNVMYQLTGDAARMADNILVDP